MAVLAPLALLAQAQVTGSARQGYAGRPHSPSVLCHKLAQLQRQLDKLKG